MSNIEELDMDNDIPLKGVAPKLFKYALSQKKMIILALVTLVLGIVIELTAPLVLMHIIDNYILIGGSTWEVMPLIFRWAGIYLGLIIAAALFSYVQQYVLAVAANKIIMKMRNEVFTHVQTMPIKYFDSLPAGKIVARITNDTQAVRNFYLGVLTNFVAGGIQMISVLVMLFLLNWRFALLALLLIPVIIAWIIIYRKVSTPINKKIRSLVSEINAILNESISGMTIIQAFRQEKKTQTEFKKINEEYYTNQRKMLFLDASTSWNFLDTLQSLALVAVIWFFGGQFLQEQTGITVGLMTIFVDYTGRLFRPLMNIVGQLSSMDASIVSAGRVLDLMDQENEAFSTNRIDRYAGNVRFDNVNFCYDPENPVLKNINIEAKSGETVALVGHTGSGKSSIMSALFGFYPYQEGSISIDGQKIDDLSKQEYRQHMGIVLQDAYLFAGTIASNIGLDDPRISREKIEEALTAVGAMDFVSKLEKGLDEPVSEKGSTFSTGQRQLLSFARALAFDPAILILDEATANIDTETEGIIQAALEVLKKGRTTFVIAHRLSTIRNADQILVLDRGTIIERGNHDELMTTGGKYHQMYELQLKGAS